MASSRASPLAPNAGGRKRGEPSSERSREAGGSAGANKRRSPRRGSAKEVNNTSGSDVVIEILDATSDEEEEQGKASARSPPAEEVEQATQGVSAGEAPETSEGSDFVLVIKNATSDEEEEQQRQQLEADCQKGSNEKGAGKVKCTDERSAAERSAKPASPPLEPVSNKGATAGDGVDAILTSADRVLRFLRRRLTDTLSTRKDEILSSYQMAMRPKLKQASEQVEEMISDVVQHGNSTSILLIGDRGAGKTLALDYALRNIQTRFNSEQSERQVGIVRLNGLVTSGDRAVLKEIALQICELFGLSFSSSASYEENICFLKQSLEQIGKAKAVVFVLDELDALTQRTKQQTTLYNLFDALQSASVLACVVGVTTRHDVIELLEKRVQSRFSHRKILISVPQVGKAPSGTGGSSASDPTPIEFLKEILLHPPSKTDPNITKFNSSVAKALSSRSLQEAIAAATAGSYSTRWLCNVGLLSIAQVDRRKCVLEAVHTQSAMSTIIAMEAGQEDLVPQLSVLQLYLLVAFCRLAKKDAKYCNFQTALNEYTSLLRSNSDTCEKFSHSTALRAFEDLITSGMIGREGHTSAATSPLLEYQQVCLLLSPAEIEAGLKKHPNCPSILQQWLAKEAVARFNVDVE